MEANAVLALVAANDSDAVESVGGRLLNFLEVVLSSIVSSGFPSELGEERQVVKEGVQSSSYGALAEISFRNALRSASRLGSGTATTLGHERCDSGFWIP